MPRWLWALWVTLAGASAPYTHTLRAHGWLAELRENHAIRAPHAHDCRFYSGRIIGEEDSRAAVAECAGEIYGVLQARGRDVYLQPGGKLRTRVVRRRDLSFVDHPPVFDLVGDTVEDLDFDVDDDDDLPRPPRAQNDIQYSQFRTPIITRPLSGVKGLWLELAIVADHTVVKFHGRERVNHYILALMNIVSAIFNDASLDSNMTLVIKKLFLYQEKDSVIKYGNVKKSLEAVNKWNYKHLDRLPDDSESWDATVWLTRAPLGGPSGFAPVGGVCSRTRSAAINRDEGLTSAFVIAHEVAHLLGLTHDGDGDCDEESRRGTVMATTVLATLHKYAWSNCSKRQFHERSKGWWCMQDRNQDRGVVLGGAKEISNYVFTMDEQCRTEFGDGFSVCKSVKLRSPCGRLWCAHRSLPQVCRSKRAPPLEGTPCGYNHWCVDRVCEPMPGNEDGAEVDSKEQIDLVPKWEEWSTWSDCDVKCGYGLRIRSRQCTFNGSPSEDCEGPNTEASTCWNGHECAAKWDPRAALCRDYSNTKNYIPYWPDDESQYCQALCINYKGGDVRKLGPVQNGTSCSYERPYDICFQGKCIKGECNSSDPLCNWCADGYCNNNTIFYYPKLRRDSGWTRTIVIPHDAHQLSVHISTPVSIELAIREKGKNKPMIEFRHHYTKRFEVKNFADNTINYDPNVPQNLQIIEIDNYDMDSKVENAFGYEGHIIAAGTILRWKQTFKDIFITSDSPMQSDLMIMANRRYANSSGLAALEVSVNYSTPANRRRPLEYRLRTEKGPCSVSCGGGQRWVRSRCVPGRQCAPVRYESCNLHKCEYTWTTSYWEECSETCGENGVQERQIFCVPTSASNYTNRMDLIYHSVSPALCFSPRPSTRQQCNQLPCPVYWQELPWSQCSATCGRGTSIRPLSCPAEDEILCGPKPQERHKKCRLRRCPPIRPPPSCQGSDASQYCELFPSEQLTRNCIVPLFRNYCCNACRENDIFSMHRG